ncbi:hypothetical protein D3C85_1298530 [compost metagenome]
MVCIIQNVMNYTLNCSHLQLVIETMVEGYCSRRIVGFSVICRTLNGQMIWIIIEIKSSIGSCPDKCPVVVLLYGFLISIINFQVQVSFIGEQIG